jgi:hypothetical protein
LIETIAATAADPETEGRMAAMPVDGAIRLGIQSKLGSKRRRVRIANLLGTKGENLE